MLGALPVLVLRDFLTLNIQVFTVKLALRHENSVKLDLLTGKIS